jgi:hypothetical protein
MRGDGPGGADTPGAGRGDEPAARHALITGLVQKIRACARSLAILICVEGVASYSFSEK